MSRSVGKLRLVQIAAGYAPHDAITAEMEIIAEHVRAGRGAPFGSSLILAEQIPPGQRARCRRLEEYRPRPDDRIVLHYGMTLEGFDLVRRWPGPKALVYHNITPAEFFRSYDPVTAGRLLRARACLSAVIAACDLTFAVSEFNAVEMRAAGATEVLIKPVLFPAERIAVPAKPEVARPERRRLLFVGRFAPNKNHLDLIKLTALLRQRLPVRLSLVGGAGGPMDAYVDDLKQVVRQLELEDSVEFVLDADNARLAQLYRDADLFLCTTLHEGFCVPLLEAMAADLPVLARQADDTAVRETMGGAGIGFLPPRTTEDYRTIAGAAEILLTDQSLRERVLAGQRRRLDSYRPEEILSDFFRSLETLV